jgi:hypothetical protein
MHTFVAMCMLVALPLLAQDASTPEEPEYINNVFRLDANGMLKALERQTSRAEGKYTFPVFGMRNTLVISGEHSPVRFKADENLEFVVRVAQRDVDPHDSIQFFAFKPSKGKRELLLQTINLTVKRRDQENAVAFVATKYGQFSFRIRPESRLPPGEYAISTTSTNDAYCFGVDPK